MNDETHLNDQTNLNEQTNTNKNTSRKGRGFASMDDEKRREIASKGGKTAHEKGKAHKWTSNEAVDAGRKGGLARIKNLKKKAED